MEKNKIYVELTKIVDSENIRENENMKNHTSLKIGGVADFFVKVETIQQIRDILKFTKESNIPLFVIGNGSNLLVRDKGIRGIILKIDLKDIQIQTVQEYEKKLESNSSNNKELNNKNDYYNSVAEIEEVYKKQVAEKKNNVIVKAGAGITLGLLAQKLFKLAITGFEFAAGIPGTIGGAVTMNAGAYGTEFKDIVIETTCMDMDGNIIVLNNTEHNFEYRNSIFKTKKLIILGTTLLLEQATSIEPIKQKMDELAQKRREKQPIDMPSAGSTFKRGTDFITAQLIDECGLKGFSIGGAQISEKHAGFVVNTGNATAEDVLSLVEYIKKVVKEKFDKNIELEVQIIGE